jgi:Type II CAAX prenyl endopeptidase Rce1-like
MQNMSTTLLLSISYAGLLLLFGWAKKMKTETVLSETVLHGHWDKMHIMNISATVIMLVPVLFIGQLPLFLFVFPDKISIEKAIAFLSCFGLLGFFPWKKLRQQIDKNNIVPASRLQISLHVSQRIIFLITYEWFVRGLLLVSCFAWLGLIWGIIINTVLYMGLHIHKNKKEMLGCIPFGLLLCVFTIWWQSIWPAIIFHLQIAIINEWPDVQQFLSLSKRTAI